MTEKDSNSLKGEREGENPPEIGNLIYNTTLVRNIKADKASDENVRGNKETPGTQVSHQKKLIHTVENIWGCSLEILSAQEVNTVLVGLKWLYQQYSQSVLTPILGPQKTIMSSSSFYVFLPFFLYQSCPSGPLLPFWPNSFVNDCRDKGRWSRRQFLFFEDGPWKVFFFNLQNR